MLTYFFVLITNMTLKNRANFIFNVKTKKLAFIRFFRSVFLNIGLGRKNSNKSRSSSENTSFISHTKDEIPKIPGACIAHVNGVTRNAQMAYARMFYFP